MFLLPSLALRKEKQKVSCVCLYVFVCTLVYKHFQPVFARRPTPAADCSQRHRGRDCPRDLCLLSFFFFISSMYDKCYFQKFISLPQIVPVSL